MCCLAIVWVTPAQGQTSDVIEEDLEETFEAPPVTAEVNLDSAAVEQLFNEAETTYTAEDPAAFALFGRLVEIFETHLQQQQQAEEAAATLADRLETTGLEQATTGAPIPDESSSGSTTADLAAGEPQETSPDEPTEALSETGDGSTAILPGPPPAPAELRFLDPDMRRVFARALLYRGQLAYDFGEDELVDASLERVLQVDPEIGASPKTDAEGVEIPQLPIPAALEEPLKRLRRKRLGQVEITVDPPDAMVLIAGRPAAPDSEISAPAGSLWLQVSRPGYVAVEEEVELRAAKTLRREVVLERQSPVLRFHTRPSDTQVFLDGQPVGTTSGQATDDLIAVGRYRSEEFSTEMVLSDFAPGVRQLEIRKAGFRPYRAELELYELLDYPLPPIVLEGERGLLVFRNFPNDGRLLVDGTARSADNPGSSRPQLTLPPGEYNLTVESGRSSMFSTKLRLADRQTIDVDIKLRPGLTFLGVISDNAGRRGDLEQALRLTLGRSGKWSLLDRSHEADRLLQGLKIDHDALRQEASAAVVGRHVDWSQMQWSADQRTPGLLYVLAVVSESLLEQRTTLFIWPSAPGPAVPDRVQLAGTDSATLQRLQEAFNRPLQLHRPWLGAVLVNSPLSPHPLVYDVTPGGPAEAAGLLAGDQLVAISQVPVFSQHDVMERLKASEVGEVLELGVQRRDGPHGLRFNLRASPQVIDFQEKGRLVAVTFTDLMLEEKDASPETAWQLRLDQGRLLLAARQWEEAARRLKSVDAPQTSHGFGQAAVDYWLGLALEKLGSEYRDAARQAFERAARLPGARLGHHDGPFVAPRAQARLLALGSF